MKEEAISKNFELLTYCVVGKSGSNKATGAQLF